MTLLALRGAARMCSSLAITHFHRRVRPAVRQRVGLKSVNEKAKCSFLDLTRVDY
jgi:hypothetical protein